MFFHFILLTVCEMVSLYFSCRKCAYVGPINPSENSKASPAWGNLIKAQVISNYICINFPARQTTLRNVRIQKETSVFLSHSPAADIDTMALITKCSLMKTFLWIFFLVLCTIWRWAEWLMTGYCLLSCRLVLTSRPNIFPVRPNFRPTSSPYARLHMVVASYDLPIDITPTKARANTKTLCCSFKPATLINFEVLKLISTSFFINFFIDTFVLIFQCRRRQW